MVNEAEAERVRAIFNLYLEHEALLPVVQELGRREWTTKCWTTRAGAQMRTHHDKYIAGRWLIERTAKPLRTGAYGWSVRDTEAGSSPDNVAGSTVEPVDPRVAPEVAAT